MRTEEEIKEILASQGCVLRVCRQEERASLYEIYREVVQEGSGFPYEDISDREFRRHFFSQGSTVFICRSSREGVIGGFFLKANLPGRSGHIANAAYMIRCDARGKGLGRLLCEASLHLAKQLGFLAIQYNMVLSQNIPAVNLYTSLGFEIVARLPNAVRNGDGTFQTGYIMYRDLK